MQDTDFYQQILGLREPWEVREVELSVEGKRVTVSVGYREGNLVGMSGEPGEVAVSRSCGHAAGGIWIRADLRRSWRRGCRGCGEVMARYDGSGFVGGEGKSFYADVQGVCGEGSAGVPEPERGQ